MTVSSTQVNMNYPLCHLPLDKLLKEPCSDWSDTSKICGCMKSTTNSLVLNHHPQSLPRLNKKFLLVGSHNQIYPITYHVVQNAARVILNRVQTSFNQTVKTFCNALTTGDPPPKSIFMPKLIFVLERLKAEREALKNELSPCTIKYTLSVSTGEKKAQMVSR